LVKKRQTILFAAFSYSVSEPEAVATGLHPQNTVATAPGSDTDKQYLFFRFLRYLHSVTLK
jgi:hypothetical protein